MEIEAFVKELQGIARRLGYPMDAEAVCMLAAAVPYSPEQWLDPLKRDAGMDHLRKLMIRAVLKAVNGGRRFVDGRIMAMAIADCRSAATQEAVRSCGADAAIGHPFQRSPTCPHPHPPSVTLPLDT